MSGLRIPEDVLDGIFQQAYDQLPRAFVAEVERFKAKTWELHERRREIQGSSAVHPDNAGSQCEQVWLDFIRAIVPDEFKVRQGVRFDFEDLSHSPQLDIAILRPGGEKGLHETGYYHPSSILAAFECKLSLTQDDVRKYSGRAHTIKNECGDSGLVDLPCYGLLGLGMGRPSTMTADRMIETIMEENLEAPIGCALDCVLVPELSFFEITHEEDVFESGRMNLCIAREMEIASRKRGHHVPLLGFALFLAKLVAKESERFAHMVDRYAIYKDGIVTTGRHVSGRREEG